MCRLCALKFQLFFGPFMRHGETLFSFRLALLKGLKPHGGGGREGLRFADGIALGIIYSDI